MNNSVEIDGITYNVGDKLTWYNYRYSTNYTGVIKFGIYDDNESYETKEHIGYYLEYPVDESNVTETLIDCIKVYNAKKVE